MEVLYSLDHNAPQCATMCHHAKKNTRLTLPSTGYYSFFTVSNLFHHLVIHLVCGVAYVLFASALFLAMNKPSGLYVVWCVKIALKKPQSNFVIAGDHKNPLTQLQLC